MYQPKKEGHKLKKYQNKKGNTESNAMKTVHWNLS